ncbi:MAG: 6-phosphofructokinase [Clostridiales bacterium]|nr:6-phosphofructokinase [Clostridiales bacterium]
MKKIKKIGILTSGGDAPGMNAAIRSVVRTGIHYGYEMYGIYHGYDGLVSGEIEKLEARDVSGILQKGGTKLKTSRCPAFLEKDTRDIARSMCKVFGIDVVVVIGGDGSYRGALALANEGLPVVCIPGTIDNDIGCTDYTIGFDTALNTVQDAIDKIRDTAYSHERCYVIEVMGRNAGYIALNNGIAGGADAILIPEEPFNINDVIKIIIEGRNRGKDDFTIIVAEGVKNAQDICALIEENTGIISRYTILGYVQRGGSPSAYDRVMASRMGDLAIKTINQNNLNKIISLKNNQLVAQDIDEALKMTKTIDKEMLEVAKILSI